MKNFGLSNVKIANVENFTTDVGMKIRRTINKPLRSILKMATKREIIVERYPELPKGKNYIFASTHSFDEDIIANLATIDRNAYVLMGTTDQIDHNPQMYAAWLNGMIYVDRQDKESRKMSVEKMKRVLNSGSSVLVFPEGGWNNTENLLCQKLFASPYILAKETGCEVVPISAFNEHGSNKIYINVGDPIDLTKYSKVEALDILRDKMGSMMFESIEKHSTPLKREELVGDIHLNFMEERRKEYMRVNWTRDVWDEELTVYKSKETVTPEEVWDCVDKIKIDKHNANVFAPILVKRLEHKKYDFKKYMKDNWNK